VSESSKEPVTTPRGLGPDESEGPLKLGDTVRSSLGRLLGKLPRGVMALARQSQGGLGTRFLGDQKGAGVPYAH
jgi:hypothetical protein